MWAVTAALATAIVVSSTAAALAEKRVALVIGNATYAALGTLANPTNDADDIASTLRGMGFEVTVANDADERKFTDLLSNFATSADDADIALFYYSGHGLQYRSENYLVPVDATLANRFSLTHETIPLDDVLSAVSGARDALIYIDACRSFPIAGTFLASSNERVAPVGGLAPVQETHNTFIGFSASAGQTARDGAGRNSPFTTAMLDLLPTPGLDVTEMFNDVSARVVSATDGAQKPQSFNGITSDVTLVAAADTGPVSPEPDAEERAYRDASAIGTLGAYRAFIARFPGGFYSELAREAMDKLQNMATVSPAPSAEPDTAPDPVLDLPADILEPNLSYFGKGKEKIGDWTVSANGDRCHMYTEAEGVSPDGWLTYRPWLYYSALKNQASVWSSMFTANKPDGSDIFAPGTVRATVMRADGMWKDIPALFFNTELRMLSPCVDASLGQFCIDADGVDAMRQGQTLTISGKSAQTGAPVAITYGITGYADAAQRISAMCKSGSSSLYGGMTDKEPAKQ